MPARRAHHRASLLACATLAAALAVRPGPVEAASGGEEIHVTLSGEELGDLPAPPVARDAPFGMPVWDEATARAELLRSPLDAPRAGAPAPRGVGVGLEGTPAGPRRRLETPAAPAGAPPAPVGAGAGGAGTGVATARTEPAAAAGSGAAQAASPEAGALAAAALPGPGAPQEAPPVLPPAPGEPSPSGSAAAPSPDVPGALRAVPDLARPEPPWYGVAGLALSWRPGHRFEADASMELGVGRLTAGLDMEVITPDEVVPSPLSSPASLLGRSRLGAALPRGSLVAELSALLHSSASGVASRAATGSAAVDLRAGAAAVDWGTEVAACARSDAAGPAWAVHQWAGLRLEAAPGIAFRGGLDAGLGRAAATGAAGHALAALELDLPERFLALSGGLAVALDAWGQPVSAGVLPVARLAYERGGSVALGVEIGPSARWPEELPLLLAAFGAPAEAPGPERAFAARAWFETRGGCGASARAAARYAGGLLWVLRGGSLQITPARRLAGTVGAALELAGGEVALSAAPAGTWLEGAASGLFDLTARLDARAGFWRAGLAAILRPGRRSGGAGAAGSDQGTGELDARPGLQIALDVSRALPGGASLAAEARLLSNLDGRGLVAAFQLGGSLGVR